MIPRLKVAPGVQARYLGFLDALKRSGFRGELRPDLATRLVTATDNSIYQVLPQAVVYPRDAADVETFVRLAAEPRFSDLTFSPRGGGTGTNGQSLTDGLVLDVSRHMNGILEVDLEAGWARVEPGVVLDQLNADPRLKGAGLFFAPSLSPSSRATLGGMISTDAAGIGSRVYGKTSDHVLELDLILMDGTRWTTRKLTPEQLAEVCQRDDLVGEVHRTIDEVVTTHAELIAERFPKLRRFMTGYNLAMVWDEARESFDLGRLICGSEGTLAVVVGAKLKLTPRPRHRRVAVLKYATFNGALESALALVAHDPMAVESIDDTIVGLARGDVIWRRVGRALADAPNAPRTRAINLVEFAAPEEAEAQRQMDAFVAAVEAGREAEPDAERWPHGWVVAADEAEAKALWDLRKKGVGLLGNAPGPRKPVAFVEDTAVPPQHLPEYIRAFRAILDEEGLTYGMFGHIDVGCLHVRPALDLKDPEDHARVRRVSDRVAALAQSFGGVLWGEHGKGFRSEYSPRFFGDALFTQLRRVKGVFDPANRLNPGKLATPLSLEGATLTGIDAPTRGEQDRQIPLPVRQSFTVAVDCNGNGQCFHWSPDHVMCPSSKVTRDRIHSPKGRAGLTREWLRQLAHAGASPLAEEEAPKRWLTAPVRGAKRCVSSVGRAFGAYDYSHEVYGAMSGCLACKACATQCPVKVDVPDFRSRFLDLYHGRYLRPLRDHLVAMLEGVLPMMSKAPRLFNVLTRAQPFRWLLARVAGVVDVPALPHRRLSRELSLRGRSLRTCRDLEGLTDEERERGVVVVQDAFTSFYEPRVVAATVDVLTRLGYAPHVLAYFPNGKGLHVKGFGRRFRRRVAKNVSTLNAAAALGMPIVGIDPAVVLTYRDEYPKALGVAADDLGFEVQLLQDFLAATIGDDAPSAAPGRFTLLGHCTERALAGASLERWVGVFERLGLELALPEVGCCGMSGMYGHERAHAAESRGIYEMSWAPRLAALGEDAPEQALATGFSCRSQVKRFGELRLRHPIEALAEALT